MVCPIPECPEGCAVISVYHVRRLHIYPTSLMLPLETSLGLHVTSVIILTHFVENCLNKSKTQKYFSTNNFRRRVRTFPTFSTSWKSTQIITLHVKPAPSLNGVVRKGCYIVRTGIWRAAPRPPVSCHRMVCAHVGVFGCCKHLSLRVYAGWNPRAAGTAKLEANKKASYILFVCKTVSLLNFRMWFFWRK